MSGIDAALVEEATAGMRPPAKGQEDYVCTALSDLSQEKNVTFRDRSWVLGVLLGASLTDADDPALDVGDGSLRRLPAGTLTANRQVTLDDTNPTTGEVIIIERLDTEAFTLAIVNGGVGGGTLYTFPVSQSRMAKFKFDGTNWALEEHWRRA